MCFHMRKTSAQVNIPSGVTIVPPGPPHYQRRKKEREIYCTQSNEFKKKGSVISFGSEMPYKTPAPHATHRQESAAAQDSRARAGIIQKASSSRGPFLFATLLCPETPGSLEGSPYPLHAEGACGTEATELHSQRGRHSSEAPRQSRSPPARIAAPRPGPAPPAQAAAGAAPPCPSPPPPPPPP